MICLYADEANDDDGVGEESQGGADASQSGRWLRAKLRDVEVAGRHYPVTIPLALL